MTGGYPMVSSGRDSKGKFVPGNPGGPGRKPRSQPLHDAMTPERAQAMWEARVEIAESDPDPERRDRAAEFVLRHHTGMPVPRQPDVPPLDSAGPIASVEGIVRALPGLFAAHSAGQVDSTGLEFGVRILERAANLLGLVESTRARAGATEQAQPYTIIVQAAVPPPAPEHEGGAVR